VLTGPAPVLVLVVVAAVAGALRGGFTDLFVYQYSGRAVLDGLPLYESGDPVTGLSFTYPPFAAMVMVPLALLPAWLAAALWTGASVGALAAAVVVVRRALGRPAPGWLVALLTGGALALEPVWQNLAFGQINLFLMLVILVDLVRPERRWSGVLVGIAAGVKLTPLVFVVLLVLVGRRPPAGRAVLAFAGTVALGFLAMPGSATKYWTDGLVEAGRIGPPALAHNQSAFGALTRLLDGPPSNLLWLAVAGPLSLAVLLVGAAWWRRGDRVLGTSLGALAMLIASPVSWSHHWVWAVPVALAVWERSRWAGAAWTAVFVARPVVWPPWGQGREYDWSPADHVVGNAYVLAAVALSVWAAATLSRRVGESARDPERAGRQARSATITRLFPSDLRWRIGSASAPAKSISPSSRATA
jgi:alpha-1,2-mannosyltransferase